MNYEFGTGIIRYEKIKQIGEDEGRNSKVFIIKDTQLNAELIMKEIEINNENFENFNGFFRESQILYENRHPNIMEIQYAASDYKNNKIRLMMPYYKNGSLDKILKARYLTVREIIKYSLDFLGGLLYIHAKGLIHLDIKPNNILINNSGKAVLADFGLSRYLDEEGKAVQKKAYRLIFDPELIMGMDRRISSDIYQVGLTLYRMCNGTSTLVEQEREIVEFEKEILNGRFPNRNKYLPHIPNELRKIVNRALEVDIEKRYKSVLEIMNDLSDINKNLDIQYLRDSEKMYTFNKGDSIINIYVNDDESGKNIRCVKSCSNGSTINMNKYSSTGHNTEKELFDSIEVIFKELA